MIRNEKKNRIHDEEPFAGQELSLEELRLLIDNMISPFSYYRMIYDEEGRTVDYEFLAVNRAFEIETGKTREEIVGKRALSLFPETEKYWIECFGRVGKTGISEQISNYSAAFDKWYKLLAFSPKPEHVAVTVSDISNFIKEQRTLQMTAEELRAQQQENYRLAHEEPISGLPNRASLYEAMAERMAHKPERKGFMLAIFTPDNLAEILATYGSVLSDEIMRAIAQRLKELVNPPDMFFSMTGTDLVLLYSSKCDTVEARRTLALVNEAIRTPIKVEEGVFYITASCGVACYPKDSVDRDDLIMKANLALFQAKELGEPIGFYDEEIGLELLHRTRIRNELPKALEREEFELFFQPQISSATDRILGFEALLRWHSAALGDVSPLEFISVAEESRQILPIGAWVMRNAIETLCQLNERCGTEFCMAVNVSGVQLRVDDFVDQVLGLLSETGLKPSLLEIEVTESVLINRTLHAIEKLNALHKHGVRIALDDFGTGYSSLGLLKDLKVSTLKIDKVFIQDPSAAVLTKMIARLGHTLGAEIVAEGVETEEQLKFVRRAGCDRVQGFYRGLPMPLTALERFIALKEGR
ncbi:MAG: hypothetical protein CVV04_11495 [Firmicutes bacterium HGW-Firmicutes-9]|jgi:diguanylate cyclase (GGDEF)-like protein|nr:MAG: hypothetical protein CVV04_11495 [Firmicutes bacterium HGW-Firmicutes-9]